MARPKKTIDYKEVEKLAAIMCTQEEIGSHLDISVRTLQKDEEFLRVYKKGLDGGRKSLRRQQYELAMNGNATMLVWLGKQYLDQKDNKDLKITDLRPIKIEDDLKDEIE